MRKHYAVRPYSNDRVVITGLMTVQRSLWMRILSPFLKIFGALIPYDGKDIPASVTFYSGPQSTAFHFDRVLQLPEKAPLRFHSRLVQISGNDVIELMRFGLGWRSRYHMDGGNISLRQIGYFWRAGGTYVPLPIAWIMGDVAAAEMVTGDNSFKMWMKITHPLFGEIYRYDGTFEVTEVIAA